MAKDGCISSINNVAFPASTFGYPMTVGVRVTNIEKQRQ